MNDVIGLVLCKHRNEGKKYLFRAPAYSSIDKGDTVVVEDQNGETMATVVGYADVIVGNEEYEMILECCGATLPLKRVLSKVVYREFRWDEDDLTDGKE